MHRKSITVVVLALLYLAMITLSAQAATISGCTFDRDVYQQGENGTINVVVYNDRDEKIRVTELTAMIDYFYSDGTVYVQTFYTNATLPVEILQGESGSLYVPFTLPNNIASGYTRLFVRAKTEIWSSSGQRWFASDTATYQPVLFVESPYKQQFEHQQFINKQLEEEIQELQTASQQLQEQLDQQQNTNALLDQRLNELEALNSTYTMIMFTLGAMTLVFTGVIMLLIVANRKNKVMSSL